MDLLSPDGIDRSRTILPPDVYTVFAEEFLEVKNKAGRIVPFVYNSIQQRFIEERTGRDVILKLRQPGITTQVMGIYFTDFLLLNGIDVAIVAHTKTPDVLRPLREKLTIFLQSVYRKGEELLEGLEADTIEYLSFPSRGCSFRITTAGGGAPLQSSTVHRAHFTEVSLMKGDVEEIITGALDSVPESGAITMESRGTIPSGYFHDYYWDSKAKKTGYKSHFYGTQDFPEYSKKFLAKKRKEYRGRHYLYKRHYPATDKEAFQMGAKGELFRREYFEFVSDFPRDGKFVRFWDKAATEKKKGNDPDFTAGVLICQKDGIYYIVDVVRFRGTPFQVERTIRATAELDQQLYGEIEINMEEEPGSSGKDTIDHYRREVLPEFFFKGKRPKASKMERLEFFAGKAEGGNVKIVKGPWNKDFIEEVEAQPDPQVHDDQADATAGGIKSVSVRVELY